MERGITWQAINPLTPKISLVILLTVCHIVLQGVKLIFFSDSHLAPKFFKVVANSKEVGRHFQRQTNLSFYAVIVLEIKLGKDL